MHTSMFLSAHLHASLYTPPCISGTFVHTSVHKSHWLSVPTTANQIISIDQPNYHKNPNFCLYLCA